MKAIKKLGMVACVGATMLGMASPVMAAQPGEIDATYTIGGVTSGNGRIVMVIPANVSLTYGNRTMEGQYKLKMVDGTNFPADLNAQTKVSSKNEGKLKVSESNNTDVINYEMFLLTGAGQTTETKVNLTKAPVDMLTYNNGNTAGKSEVAQKVRFRANEANATSIENKFGSGQKLTDVLTFSLNVTAGSGLI